jgi:hypothetical protein
MEEGAELVVKIAQKHTLKINTKETAKKKGRREGIITGATGLRGILL